VLVAGGAAGAALLVGKDSPPKASNSPLATALVLERMQAAFYADAIKQGVLDGELRDFAVTAQAHEVEHGDLLAPLVADSTGRVTFDFGDATSNADAFAAAAATLEDLAVAAYNGVMSSLDTRGRGVASRIVSVDARHAAWVRAIIGKDPAAAATDPGLGSAEVLKRLAATGFMKELTP
jgi:Ferritin-like domain